MRLPLTFLALAAASGLAWWIPDLLGWAEHTAFLTGQVVDPGSVARGAAYLVAWLQFVVVAPILVIGAAAVPLLHVAGLLAEPTLEENLPWTVSQRARAPADRSG